MTYRNTKRTLYLHHAMKTYMKNLLEEYFFFSVFSVSLAQLIKHQLHVFEKSGYFCLAIASSLILLVSFCFTITLCLEIFLFLGKSADRLGQLLGGDSTLFERNQFNS